MDTLEDNVETEVTQQKPRARLFAAALLFDIPECLDSEIYGASNDRPPLKILAEYVETMRVNGKLPSLALIGEKILERTDWQARGADQNMMVRQWAVIEGMLADLRENEVDAEIVRRDAIAAARLLRVERLTMNLAKLVDLGNIDDAVEEMRRFTAEAPTTATPNPGGFKPMKLRDLILQPPPQPDWILPPYLQRGQLVVLSGYAKTGKSTFAYPLCIAVLTGEPFIGFTPTRKTRVLILAVEESLSTAYTRLSDFGGIRAQDLDVHVGALRNDPKTLADIEAFIVANDIGLVLVDTLSRFWQVWQENDARMVDRELSPLLEIARRTNACIFLLHHDGKNEQSKGVRGSSVITDIVDLQLVMRLAGEQSPIRTIEAKGRGEFPTELSVTYDRESRLWSLVSEADVAGVIARAAAQPESLRSMIITAIADSRRGVTPTILSAALERPIRSISNELAAMRRGGLVLNNRGVYTLPTDGAIETPEPTGRAPRSDDAEDV